LKNESVRIIKKIINNYNQNILFKSKYSKFGIEKYTNNYTIEDNEENSNKINECSSYIKYHWLHNKNNSCRYDCFITIYGFCIKDYLYQINYKFNDNFNILNLTFEDLLKNPTSNSKFILWDYFAKSGIEPINPNINKNINGLDEEGFITQLFKIFKNDIIFCLDEKKKNN